MLPCVMHNLVLTLNEQFLVLLFSYSSGCYEQNKKFKWLLEITESSLAAWCKTLDISHLVRYFIMFKNNISTVSRERTSRWLAAGIGG